MTATAVELARFCMLGNWVTLDFRQSHVLATHAGRGLGWIWFENAFDDW